jgi:hypothetical protein
LELALIQNIDEKCEMRVEVERLLQLLQLMITTDLEDDLSHGQGIIRLHRSIQPDEDVALRLLRPLGFQTTEAEIQQRRLARSAWTEDQCSVVHAGIHRPLQQLEQLRLLHLQSGHLRRRIQRGKL